MIIIRNENGNDPFLFYKDGNFIAFDETELNEYILSVEEMKNILLQLNNFYEIHIYEGIKKSEVMINIDNRLYTIIILVHNDKKDYDIYKELKKLFHEKNFYCI